MGKPLEPGTIVISDVLMSKRRVFEFCAGPSMKTTELLLPHHSPRPPSMARGWSEPPSIDTRYIPCPPPTPNALNRICLPSDEKVGAQASRGARVSCSFSVPSTRLRQTSLSGYDK